MNNLIFKSQDFYISCILRASKIPLKEIVRNRGNFVLFIFDAPQEKCEQIIKKHWDGDLHLSTRTLIETINELKSRIHEKMQ